MEHMTRLALIAAAAIMAVGANAQASATKAKNSLEKWMESQGAVGMSAAVVKDGKIIFNESFGYENRETKVKASNDTVYRLASISKPLTAIGFMLLEEQNKADLDKPVTTYNPTWPETWKPVTPRHLLTHTSGIRHYATGKNDNGFTQYRRATDAVKKFSSDELIYKPGSKSQYSTHAFTLLAAIIERQSGMAFQDYMSSRVFSKSKSKTLQCEDLTKTAPKHRSELYAKGTERASHSTRRNNLSWKFGGGGMESSAKDLALFAADYMAGKIVKPATVKEMMKPQGGAAGGARGLSWSVRGDEFSHSGSQQGCASLLVGFTDSNVAIVVLCNTSGVAPGQAVGLIAEALGLMPDQAASAPVESAA
jgi:CubicO group peptidase (beta-lactamase class C family)